MSTATPTWTEDFVPVAGEQLHVLRGGMGEPLIILHHDIGNPGWLPFYERLAARFAVSVPSHPGYGRSTRPAWMRSVRDVAVAYQWLLSDLGIEQPTLLGLGFGGWIAAEMATMAPRAVKRLILVGAMGVQPPEGEIFDQALVHLMDYIRTGLYDPRVFDDVFGAEPDTDQLEQWEVNREMTFRLAWKPYMFSQTLPYLLGGVRAPALIVWGDDDRIVPISCGERYAQLLRQARREVIPDCGHFVDLEKPEELARLIVGSGAG